MLDIFHRAPSYGVVLVALECHLSESLLFGKCNAQMLDIFHRAPSYGVVLVALECHLSSLHVLCLHRRYTALN